MKTHIRLSVIAITIAVLAAPAGNTIVQATAPAPPPPGGTFAQRLAQRKKEQAIKLEKRDKDRLESRCVRTQNAIREIQQQAGPILDNRAKVYQRIDAKLWVVIGELKLAEKDTFNLEKQRAQLAAQAKVFQTTGGYYLQTLDDIAVINCQADPTGFKALVETARAYHKQVRTQSAGIRKYVLDTIKPTIASHVAALQTKPATEDE